MSKAKAKAGVNVYVVYTIQAETLNLDWSRDLNTVTQTGIEPRMLTEHQGDNTRLQRVGPHKSLPMGLAQHRLSIEGCL